MNLLVDLLDGRVTALAFGRVGKRYVLLSRGLIALHHTDPGAFRAIILHELAHLRNRDVDIAYLTLISSWIFSRMVAIPVTLAFPLAVFDPYARKCGRRDVVKQLRKKLLRQLAVGDPRDPGYRRLRYTCSADDHLLGFIGPKAEAQEIKDQLTAFLRDELKLELSPEKTLITHARTRAARFLGYEITTQMAPSKIVRGQRAVNGKIALRVPLDVIRSKCTRYRKHGRPWHRSELQNLDDYTIVKIFGAEYRGIVQYYMLANDVWPRSFTGMAG
jgi:hypothetical protein